MKNLAITYLLFSLVSLSSYSQDTLDSIAKVQSGLQLEEFSLLLELAGVDTSDTTLSVENVIKVKNALSTDGSKYSERLVELAEKNNAPAQNLLGNCFLKGDGVTPDPEKAFYWFSKAAENGNLKALNNIGYCYEKGIGTDKNEFQAFSFYKKAALRGMPDAFVNIAQCYLNGTGTSIDRLKARAWFEKAAENGYRVGQNNAGSLYFEDGIYDKAFYWLSKAADQGSPNAMLMLGVCYEEGHGTDVDLNKARELYKKSYQLGVNDAKEMLDNLK